MNTSSRNFLQKAEARNASGLPQRVEVNALQLKSKTHNPQLRTRAPGFTLIEILVVLAIIALLAGLVIGGATSLISPKIPSTEEVFWKAVQAARKTSLESTHEIYLRFDSKEKALILDDGFAPRTFPIAGVAGGDATVDFFSTQKGAGTSGFGSVTDTQPLPSGVTFYDDGTCTPFRVQIRTAAGTQNFSIDPWTCAAVLPAAKS